MLNVYRFKRPYVPSRRTTSLFRAAFYLVIVTLVLFVIVMTLAIIDPGATYTISGTLASVVFWLEFAVVAILMSASCCLWLGMLYFLIVYDGRSGFLKGFWFVVVLLTVYFGAALYYWFVYREFLGWGHTQRIV